MKKNIHPDYYADATVTCACGNIIKTGSTVKSQKIDICSKCHPFYTGKQKLVDTAGRVEKFEAKRTAAKKHAETKTVKEESKSKKGEKYMTISDIKSLKEKETEKAKVRAAKSKKPTTKKATFKKATAKKSTKKAAAKK